MREIGVVRKEMTGDDAAPYMGYARVVLGQLKNLMQLNDLQQGKSTKYLEDGTMIQVRSVFGQDKITITRPPPPVIAEVVVTPPVPPQASDEEVPPPISITPDIAPPEEPEVELPLVDVPDVTAEGGEVAACGYYYIRDPAGPGTSIQKQPYRWTPSEGRVYLPLLAGYTAATTVAISGNGRVVVGNASSYGVTPVGVYWDADGVHQLPAGITGGTGVSEDGSHFLVGGTFGVARWTANGGLGTPITDHNGGYPPRLSRNGAYVSFSVGAFPNTRATVMDRAGRRYTAPVNSYAKDISDTGVALIGGVGNNNNYLWDIRQGTTVKLPDLLEVRAISSDGLHVAGRDWDAAAIHYTGGVVYVLEPGVTAVTASFSMCLDAVGAHVRLGGVAAIVGDMSSSAPNGDDAIWTVQAGVTTLERLPVPPSYLSDGGVVTGITIPRTATSITEGGLVTSIRGSTASVLPV